MDPKRIDHEILAHVDEGEDEVDQLVNALIASSVVSRKVEDIEAVFQIPGDNGDMKLYVLWKQGTWSRGEAKLLGKVQ